ncbi:MAG TPA: carbohydrate ABC transporter permease [Firmicutes bacterium]|jgi:ABC-type glycerol-3-phosphate transport system permease component|nr:carbohydrate ABC transporter permease [Bacillota bacterium]
MKASKVQAWYTSKQRREMFDRALTYVIVTALAVMFVIPLVWTVSSSLKSNPQMYIFPPVWIPNPIQWENYARVLQEIPFALFFKNTLWITILAGAGQVLTAAIVGYGFARFKFPGRRVLFMVLLGTMMIPREVLLVPQFILYNNLKWVDTFKPLVVPYYFGGGPFTIFLMRQFFMSVPTTLDEAAKIDGAGAFRTFWSIILPLSKPVLATASILSFQWHWNDFISPLIYLQSRENFTVSLGLRMFQSVAGIGGVPKDNLLMAASVMALLPILILFVFMQKHFVRGIVMTGIKG